jgi:ribose transport system permease protein
MEAMAATVDATRWPRTWVASRRRDRWKELRWRSSVQLVLGELLEKQWMEPAISLAVLIGVTTCFMMAVPGMGAFDNVISTLRELSEFALVAIGMAIVVISGGIDLSVGSMFALNNYVALLLGLIVGLPMWLTTLAVLLLGCVMGASNGVLVAYLKAKPFLATMVTLLVYRGITNLLDEHFSMSIAAKGAIQDRFWSWFGTGDVLAVPTAIVVLVMTVLIGHVMLSRSRLGWHITAVGASRKAARHAGIDVERVLLLSYVFSGFLTAAAAMLYAARVNSLSPYTALGMEFAVLTAVVLGGISLAGGNGTVPRALIGAATISILSKGLLLMNVGGETYTLIQAVILLVVVGTDIKWAKNRAKAIQKIYINPTYLYFEPAPGIAPDAESPFAINNRLSNSFPIGLGVVEGPEDVVLDSQARLYTGDRRGWIWRFSGVNFDKAEIFAKIGGMPLGLQWDNDGNLVICVGGMGLYSVDPQGRVTKLTDETNRTWYRLKDDSRLRLADDLDIASDGKIYFSEASVRFEAHDWIEDGLEGRRNGRLICYDPATKTTRTVLKRLVFPNGIAVSHDGNSVLIGQTWLCRILRYWISGPKKSKTEVFVDNLPGYVDNINRASDGNYWVALVGIRSPAFDLAYAHPRFRRRMMKRVPRDEWLYPSMNNGCIIKVAENGRVLESYWDPTGNSHATVTSMREHDGYLYIGGLNNNRVGRIELAEAGRGYSAAPAEPVVYPERLEG